MNKKSQSFEEFKKEMNEKYGPKFLDKMGKEITLDEYGNLGNDPNYQVLKQEYIGSIMVSTIWLGLVHSGGKIFETMLFVEEDHSTPLHCFMWRYCTLKEAEQSHLIVVKHLKRLTSKYPKDYEQIQIELEQITELQDFIA